MTVGGRYFVSIQPLDGSPEGRRGEWLPCEARVAEGNRSAIPAALDGNQSAGTLRDIVQLCPLPEPGDRFGPGLLWHDRFLDAPERGQRGGLHVLVQSARLRLSRRESMLNHHCLPFVFLQNFLQYHVLSLR